MCKSTRLNFLYCELFSHKSKFLITIINKEFFSFDLHYRDIFLRLLRGCILFDLLYDPYLLFAGFLPLPGGLLPRLCLYLHMGKLFVLVDFFVLVSGQYIVSLYRIELLEEISLLRS